MNNDIKPRSILALYRQNAHKFDKAQAEMFNGMTAGERMELLFYMAMNNSRIMQFLHEKIDPDGAVIQDMPDLTN